MAILYHTRALMCVPDPDEERYAELLEEIQRRTEHAQALEAEVRPLLEALNAFEWKYSARLRVLQQELQDLKAQVISFTQKTARVHARLVADPGGMLGDLFDRDELEEIGELFGIEVPESWLATARPGAKEREEQRQREEAEFAQQHEEFAEQQAAEEEILRRMQEARQPRMSEDDRNEVRSLYRKLARRFHPDMNAAEEQDGEARQEMMLKVNAAWQAGDLERLRGLEQESEHLDASWATTAVARRVAWAERECARLHTRCVQLKHRLEQLQSSETFPLWMNERLGERMIEHRARLLAQDIEREQGRLDDAKESFRQALGHYAVAIA